METKNFRNLFHANCISDAVTFESGKKTLGTMAAEKFELFKKFSVDIVKSAAKQACEKNFAQSALP